jgi:hypothetical protein
VFAGSSEGSVAKESTAHFTKLTHLRNLTYALVSPRVLIRKLRPRVGHMEEARS